MKCALALILVGLAGCGGGDDGSCSQMQMPGELAQRAALLVGHVEAEVQVELQDNRRRTSRAGRGHLAQPGHLAELALERRRDRRGHDLGAGTGIKRLYPDGRVVDLRQGRQRQKLEAHQAGQHDGHHQQRGRYRAQDKGT